MAEMKSPQTHTLCGRDRGMFILLFVDSEHEPVEKMESSGFWDAPAVLSSIDTQQLNAEPAARGSGGKNDIFQIVHRTKVSAQIHSSISQYDVYKVS